MYRTLLFPVLVMLFILSGCTGNSSTKQETDELATLESRIIRLEGELATVTGERNWLQIDLSAAHDSLAILYEQNTDLAKRVKAAESRLAHASAEFEDELANSDVRLLQCISTNEENATENTQLRTDNGKLQDTISLRVEQIMKLGATLDAIQPWYKHYKLYYNEMGPNYMKHLFPDGQPTMPEVADLGD